MNKRATPLGMPVWLIVSLAWFVPAFLAGIRPVLRTMGSGDPPSWQEIAFEGGDWLIYGFLTPIVFFLGREFPLRPPRLGGKIAIHFVGSILLCACWATGGLLLARYAFRGSAPEWMGGFGSWFMTSLPFGVAVYFCVLGTAQAVHYFLEFRRREEQLAEARLGALRMQLQPHFLYNSLNAITVIVRDRDTATAARMLEQLGDMLHRVMRRDRPQEVRLEEEVEFLRQYLAIEQVRFSDRLRPTITIDPGVARALVPDFILQPLVENAIRHGLARRVDASMIMVEAHRENDDLVLRVTDDGPGPGEPSASREGVGLSNTRERLATLYGERGSLTLSSDARGGAVVTVRIPYHA